MMELKLRTIRENIKLKSRTIKNIILLIFLFAFAVFVIQNIGLTLFFALISAVIGIIFFLANKNDRTIPYFSSILKIEYFKTKFRINLLTNEYNAQRHSSSSIKTNKDSQSDKIASLLFPLREERKSSLGSQRAIIALRAIIFLNQCYLKILYYFILVTKNSREGFEILREELQEKNGKKIKLRISEFIPPLYSVKLMDLKDKEREEWIDLENLMEKIQKGEVDDIAVIKKILFKLYEYYKRKRKKVAIISLASLSIIIFATVVNSLITSLIFTKIYSSKAATYNWEQTSWSSGKTANNANDESNKTGWNEYSSSGGVIATSSGEFLELDKSGLVLHYTFDNRDLSGNTIIDRSGKGNNGTFADGTTETKYPATSTTGVLRESFNFDGVDDYIDCGNDDSLNLTTAVTVSVWIKPSPRTMSPAQQCQKIIGKFVPLGVDPWELIAMDEYYFGDGSRSVRFLVSNGSKSSEEGWKAAITNSVITDNQWWHIVGTWDKSSQKVKIYVNGALENTTNTNFSSLGTDDEHFLIGRYINEFPVNENIHFGGNMDDIRVYNRALSAAEISAIYKLEVDKYTLNQTDISGTSIYGTTEKNLTSMGGPSAVTGFDGASNGALQFNGTSQYLTQPVIDTQQGTITASMVATVAFINDSGQDFSPYVGASGSSKPYMLVATDSAGKRAWGYIGEQGIGETLGDGLILSFSNGVTYLYETFTTESDDITSAINSASSGGSVSNTFSSTSGKLYKAAFTLALNSGTAPSCKLTDSSSGVGTARSNTVLSSNGVNNFYLGCTYNSSNARLELSVGSGVATNFSATDISLKQVLTPTTNGVKIYSTKTGSTQSWASVGSGFNANLISSYEIRKSDFQFISGVSVGGWVKTVSTSQMGIISKYDYGITQKGFCLEQGPVDQGNAIYMNISKYGSDIVSAKTTGYAVNDGKWHHVVGVLNPFTALTVYIDGVERDSSLTDSSVPYYMFDNLNPLDIGIERNSGAPGRFFDGSIDEPFIYDEALSAEEILAMYNDQSRTYYIPGGYLISSSFDTQNSQNAIGKLLWTESLTEGTHIKLQMRTSADGSNWTSWFGPTGTSDYYTDPLGGETVNSSHRDGSNDQWVQYKAYLDSDGISTPNLSSLNLVYGVNASPQVQNVTASQGSNGKVSISYEVLDSDTSSVTPLFQYWNGTGWADCATTAGGDTDSKSVNNETWTAYTATWTPNMDYLGHFMANGARIKVIANDNELAFNTGASESLPFTLDTKAPVFGMVIDARENPAVISVTTTDDSSLEMKLSFTEESGNYVPFAASLNMSLETNPDTIYAVFRDSYGNMTSSSATTPETPINLVYRDASNAKTSEYQLFVAWKEIADPPAGFKRYNVYAKENDGDFALIDTVNSKSTNYYLHKNLNSSSSYSYRITTQTNNNDISSYSPIISGQANGQGGGTDVVAPTISKVASSDITTTQAKITWDTEEISSSTVMYMTEVGGDFSNAQSKIENSMRDSSSGYLGAHEVILTGLTPGTDYYYKVISADPDGNTSSSTHGENGYTFTTLPGATISNVTASEINNNSATITWNTDVESDSYVVYSTNSTPTGSPTGIETLTLNHTVPLAGLIKGAKYYYYVKSTDGSARLAEDNNGGEYYTFTTTEDTTKPEVSGIGAEMIKDTSAMITWSTDEGATSKVDFGISSGQYLNSTVINTDLNLSHAVKLENLTTNTKYYYIVISRDGSNNTSTSTEQNFTTLEKLSTETEVGARETVARNEGEITGRANAGGGMIIIDKTDKVGPVIANIEVKELKSDSVQILWTTDEDAAYNFVEFKPVKLVNEDYMTYGSYISARSHVIHLDHLLSKTTYSFKILSADASGNLAQSLEQKFATLAESAEENKAEAERKEQKIMDEKLLTDQNGGLSKKEIFDNASTVAQRALEVIQNISSQVKIENLEPTLERQLEAIKKLSNNIPPPIMDGSPAVISTASTAIISWRTDKESNSLVAISPDIAFRLAHDKENPYLEVRGNPGEKTKGHVVTIYELKPETLYHYQTRSQMEFGPIVKSSDLTFRTKSEALEITNYTIENISNEKAMFKWITNLETDSQVKYIPYRDNKLMIEETKVKSDKAMSVMHEIEIDDLEAGFIYNIELAGKDTKGQLVTREIPTYSTSKDDLPPLIFQVQTDSAISPGKEERIQTIISWMTNEPSSSRVYFAKGIIQKNEELSDKTQLDKSFTKKHVAIITKFDPGSVYSFKVESIDSGGNVSISKIYTILTPRQKDSVFQVIMKNLEQTFGWVSKIRN